jgi:hypothetical protein
VLRRAAVAAALASLVVAGSAWAEAPTRPVYDQQGHLVQTPFAPTPEPTHLTKAQATRSFFAKGKVADWLGRYPRDKLITETTFDRRYRDWTVKAWYTPAGEIATGRVDDLTGVVTEAWTGPQVAWQMARGGSGAFGGKQINSIPVWLAFCAAFLVGLADFRRPLSMRNLDLLALLSFTASLWYFNHGRIFTSVPLVYPPLVYLLGRMIWIGARGRPPAAAPAVWPVWLLLAATVFLAGFRIGLNARDSNVIDVGYSGVIGAQRIASGQSPYGHMPSGDDSLKPCAAPDRDGKTSYRIQTNGRCEAGDERGDTYGPVSYKAYLPGYWFFGWKGKGDKLDAARFTSVVFDVLAIVGLALLGWRFGRARLAATLAFAWAAYPFTQYASSSNTNDAIPAVFLIFGLWLVTSPRARGAFSALSGLTKFGSLLVAPLWLSYPELRVRPREKLAFLAAFAVVTLLSFWILLLEPNPLHAARVFWDRTIPWQIGRESPFSIWDWRQYHARGLPNLRVVQIVLEVLLGIGAVAAMFLPRRKSPLQLAALTAALLIGFELVLTHWFYLYLPWFFPFVAFAVLFAAAPAPATVEAREPSERRAGELVTVR